MRGAERRQQGCKRGLCLCGAALLLLVAALVYRDRLPAPLLFTYLGASCVAFACYAVDKRAARENRRRIRESNLHLIGLLCGWPGALLAQRVLHHKSRKRPFQILFRVTVLLNCAALALWISAPY